MAENIDGTLDGSGVYNTKIPGYEQAADIQAALRLYHYGSETVPEDMSSVASNSVAGYLKNLQIDVDSLEAVGVGSAFSSTEPENPVDGFIWVDSEETSPAPFNLKSWRLKDSGTLTGSSVSASLLNGERLFIVLKDWGHDNSSEEVRLNITFNNDSGPNYVNTGGLLSSSSLHSPYFPNTDTHDLTIAVDLADTAAGLKPVSTIADTTDGQYFGYYKSTSVISSIQIELDPAANFDTGSYEIWSYEV
jgi:hypothetical protein